MASLSIRDLEGSLDAAINRWENSFELTEAAKLWRSLGNDTVLKGFVRQHALNILEGRLMQRNLEVQWLKVDAVCALLEAMAKRPGVDKKTKPNLRHRALMRQTLQVYAATTYH